MDIKTETPGDGLLYFPSHLPVLGKPHSLEKLSSEGIKEVKFATGDLVRIEADLELFKTMQDGHGGWNDAMKDVSHCLNNNYMYNNYLCIIVVELM